MSHVAKRKRQQSKPRFARAYEQYQKVALDEARCVPWPRLMQFVEESLRWEVLNLWIRAVVNAAKGVPPVFDEPLLFERAPNHRKVGEARMVSGRNKQANSWEITDGKARFLPDRLMVGMLIGEAI